MPPGLLPRSAEALAGSCSEPINIPRWVAARLEAAGSRCSLSLGRLRVTHHVAGEFP